MDKSQIITYIEQLFQYYYVKEGPPTIIETIVKFIESGQLNVDTTPLYVESLSNTLPIEYKLINKTPDHIKNKAQQYQPQKQQQQEEQQSIYSITEPIANLTGTTINKGGTTYKYYNKDTNTFNKELIKQNLNINSIKEYIDELYICYTGKLGDPASTQYLTKSLLDNSFTVHQAELHVKFSKEAKVYLGQVQIKENKRKKSEEYIYELYKVYFGKDYLCPLEDLHYYTNLIVESPSPNYQAIEDEIKEKAILNVVIPSKKPFK
ncbi:hypothetical protein RB653_008686 [Dictyostelium firmibasis]|uniref:Uncharacterized protein n=1 Tax=Dictyostelium firmibasis TaxID=79012 RepID=A0AAN7U0R0_9MYCE